MYTHSCVPSVLVTGGAMNRSQTFSSLPSYERTDSNASSGNGSLFYSSFTRSPSLGSSDGSFSEEPPKRKTIREEIRLMELVCVCVCVFDHTH